MTDQESDTRNLHHVLTESPEEASRRIEKEMESRLLLFCADCQEMTRYTADGLSWYCSECGGGSLSTDQIKQDIRRDL